MQPILGDTMKIGDLVRYIDTTLYGVIIDCEDLEAFTKEFYIQWIGCIDDWRSEDELEVICESR